MKAAELQPGVNPWSDNLHLIPMAGFEDGAVLGELENKRGKVDMTALWHTLVTEVERIKPKMMIVEPLNEVFDGDEMVRRQARQFVANLRRLAIKHDMAVILAAHPSTASVKERKPGAGSNG
jgi:RecA-family ATPase